MGILESVRNEHAGIIPRALAQLFEHVNDAHNEAAEVQVTLSFLQLYRETIQDLLAPAVLTQSSPNDENLLIREDPQRGFYVEGLQEFIVRNYSEAEALVNLGLENRAIAPTLMNATSSRSHTVLTLCLDQRGARSDANVPAGVHSRLVRSKLLLVDLAGSERVRRTVSKGTRLNEARSINTSLSALGNVIAALAEDRSTHIPYRDSKLTRLLQDSLGGTASTALVATVGPSAINYGETLSTILFSARCMSVKTTPVKHEEVDFPDLCARLQARVAQLEGQMAEKSMDLQVKYEGTITQLRRQVEAGGLQQNGRPPLPGSNGVSHSVNAGVAQLLKYLSDLQNSTGSKSRGWIDESLRDNPESSYLLPLLEYSFALLRGFAEDFDKVIKDNVSREEEHRRVLIESFAAEADREAARELELAHFAAHDPLTLTENGPLHVGGHLATLSALEALTRVEGLYRGPGGVTAESLSSHDANWANLGIYDSILSYDDPKEVANALGRVHALALHNMKAASALMQAKDSSYADVKSELVEQMVERRQREEEVVNWSCILKYLLSSSTKLKRQLKQEQQLAHPSPSRISNPISIKNAGHDDQKNSGYISESATPQSVYGANFKRLEVPYSAHSTALAEDSPLNRVRQRMSRMVEEDNLRSNSNKPPTLHGRLAQASSATQRALAQNRATLRAAQEDEDEFDQLGDAYGDDEVLSVIPGAWNGRSLRSPSPIVRVPSPASDQNYRPQRARSVSPHMRASSPAGTPSGYAQSVVRGLGVQGTKASAAAQIVDKVMKLTPAQLASMDPGTREQVLRVRRDLGIDLPTPQTSIRGRRSSPAQGGASYGKSSAHLRDSTGYDHDEDYSQI